MNVIFVAFVFSFSFGMAYDFIDSVGNDVDVVSDSEVSVLIANVVGMFVLGIYNLLCLQSWKISDDISYNYLIIEYLFY